MERLGVAYKGLRSTAPKALQVFALLNMALLEAYEGRVRSICLSAGLTQKQYQHFEDGLHGDGYAAVMLAVLIEASPSRFVAAINRVLDHYGYKPITRKAEHVPFETPEAILAEIKRVRESADKVEAFVRHAGRTTR